MQSRPRNERGMVTAEMAVGLPVLILVLCVALWGLAAAVVKLQCIDGAREAARATARGEPTAMAKRLALKAAPRNAKVVISATPAQVKVEVRAAVPPIGNWLLPDLKMGAEAVALPELPAS